MSEWQPIETAPKDGAKFLAYGSYDYPGDASPTEYQEVVTFSGDEKWPWEDAEGLHRPDFYSHWVPLPPPPSTTPDRKEGQG